MKAKEYIAYKLNEKSITEIQEQDFNKKHITKTWLNVKRKEGRITKKSVIINTREKPTYNTIILALETTTNIISVIFISYDIKNKHLPKTEFHS